MFTDDQIIEWAKRNDLEDMGLVDLRCAVEDAASLQTAPESGLDDLLNAIERLERDMADGGELFQACLEYGESHGKTTSPIIGLIKMRETIAEIRSLLGI